MQIIKTIIIIIFNINHITFNSNLLYIYKKNIYKLQISFLIFIKLFSKLYITTK